MNYIYKSLLQFCLWCEIPLKLLKVYIINVQDCSNILAKMGEEAEALAIMIATLLKKKTTRRKNYHSMFEGF